MQILLPKNIVSKLVKALKKAGGREIGGILMGEHVADGVFRVQEITIQSSGGTYSSFLRTVSGLLKPLQSFFKRTENDFVRFNYLGEWHTHPSFSVSPSSTDCKTMWDIVEDPDTGANFVVLIILKLDKMGLLEGSVTIYLPQAQMFRGELVFE